MSEIKTKRVKEQRVVLYWILFFSSLVIVAIGFLIKQTEAKWLMVALGCSLLLGIFISRLFNPNFGYNPTREEMEEKIFGNQE